MLRGMKCSRSRPVLTLLFVVLKCSWVQTTVSNVALGKPSNQHGNTRKDGVSQHAVDGDLDPAYYHYSCTHTTFRHNNWWIVDLLYHYDVLTLRIVNRDQYSERLKDFYIYVSPVNPLPIPDEDNKLTGSLCLYHAGQFPRGGPHTVQCSHIITGRFVYVWKPSHDYLSLCEFEVLISKTERARRSKCSRLHGHEITLDSVHSKHLQRPSMIQCYVACMHNSPGRLPTHLQLDKNGKCECFQISPVDSDHPPVLSKLDYLDICEIYEMHN